MRNYIPTLWSLILAHNHLDQFQALWSLQSDWFEPPNYRRGGWSGVVRYSLTLPKGGTTTVYLKRQENHLTRTLVHPFRGIPTATLEMRTLLRFQKIGLNIPEPVLFLTKKTGDKYQAILITHELTGFKSLEDLHTQWQQYGLPSPANRIPLLNALAKEIGRLHRHRIQHNALYAKHIYLHFSPSNHAYKITLIDLEGCRTVVHPLLATLRDLDTLNRHSKIWPLRNRLRFLQYYLAELGFGSRRLRHWLIRRLHRRAKEKAKRRAA